MSQENVEALRAFLSASRNRLDLLVQGRLDLSLLDPDVVFEDRILPDHAREVYRGHEGVARAARIWLDPFENFVNELEQIVGSGDRLVSIHRFRGKARHSGIEQEERFAWLWTFRNGKVVHWISFRDPAEALEAAGLSE